MRPCGRRRSVRRTRSAARGSNALKMSGVRYRCSIASTGRRCSELASCPFRVGLSRWRVLSLQYGIVPDHGGHCHERVQGQCREGPIAAYEGIALREWRRGQCVLRFNRQAFGAIVEADQSLWLHSLYLRADVGSDSFPIGLIEQDEAAEARARIWMTSVTLQGNGIEDSNGFNLYPGTAGLFHGASSA